MYVQIVTNVGQMLLPRKVFEAANSHVNLADYLIAQRVKPLKLIVLPDDRMIFMQRGWLQTLTIKFED